MYERRGIISGGGIWGGVGDTTVPSLPLRPTEVGVIGNTSPLGGLNRGSTPLPQKLGY